MHFANLLQIFGFRFKQFKSQLQTTKFDGLIIIVGLNSKKVCLWLEDWTTDDIFLILTYSIFCLKSKKACLWRTSYILKKSYLCLFLPGYSKRKIIHKFEVYWQIAI